MNCGSCSQISSSCNCPITECLWEDVQEILGQDTRRNLIIIRLNGTTILVSVILEMTLMRNHTAPIISTLQARARPF